MFLIIVIVLTVLIAMSVVRIRGVVFKQVTPTTESRHKFHEQLFRRGGLEQRDLKRWFLGSCGQGFWLSACVFQV